MPVWRSSPYETIKPRVSTYPRISILPSLNKREKWSNAGPYAWPTAPERSSPARRRRSRSAAWSSGLGSHCSSSAAPRPSAGRTTSGRAASSGTAPPQPRGVQRSLDEAALSSVAAVAECGALAHRSGSSTGRETGCRCRRRSPPGCGPRAGRQRRRAGLGQQQAGGVLGHQVGHGVEATATWPSFQPASRGAELFDSRAPRPRRYRPRRPGPADTGSGERKAAPGQAGRLRSPSAFAAAPA